MDHLSLTLIIFIIVFSLFSSSLSFAIHSPTPASSPSHPPSKHFMSQTTGLVTHAPTISRRQWQLSPPFIPSRRRHRSQSSPPPPPPGKLNLGKKLGLLFAVIAVFLQVTFAAFLIYKRWQLKKMGRRYRTRASS